jgi:hypothetical protein
MTFLEAVFAYQPPVGERELGALNRVRDVYGIRAARGETSRGPKFVLPANVRKMLRGRLAKPYPRGGFGGWSLK